MKKPENILVLTYWTYDDALIQAYTLPYVRMIRKNLPADSKVFLYTLEKKNATINERNEVARDKENEGIQWVPAIYYRFGLRAMIAWVSALLSLWMFILKNNVRVIHSWATPAGAPGYLLSLLTGKRLIIDSYEPHAEAMVENGTWKKNSLAFRLLFWFERKQTQHAFAVISATEGMRAYAQLKYACSPTRFYVKPACVDLTLFSEKDLKNDQLMDELGLRNKIICVYTGKLGGIYLDQEVFDFLRVAADYWKNSFHFLLLSNHPAQEIIRFALKAGVDPSLITLKFVRHEEIARYVGLADFALTPVKPVPTKRFCTPIKDGEYWALGLPVVIPANISDDSGIIQENNIGAVLDSLNDVSYYKAILKINELLSQPGSQRFEKIRNIARKYRSFEIAEKIYADIYR